MLLTLSPVIMHLLYYCSMYISYLVLTHIILMSLTVSPYISLSPTIHTTTSFYTHSFTQPLAFTHTVIHTFTSALTYSLSQPNVSTKTTTSSLTYSFTQPTLNHNFSLTQPITQKHCLAHSLIL